MGVTAQLCNNRLIHMTDGCRDMVGFIMLFSLSFLERAYVELAKQNFYP